MFETNFTALDWAVVAAYLATIVGLGMYVNRHIHNAADYLVGGRASGTALSIATLIGTELGLVTLMYAAMEGYNRGFAFLVMPLIQLLGIGLLGATGLGVARLRRLSLTTIPEFFERRYNRRVRIVAGLVCVLAGVLNMGLFPKMGAIFITYATGHGTGGEADFAVNLVTTILIVLVVLYTVRGGMVAVIVTDYLQFVILGLGLGLGLAWCFFSTDLGWERLVLSWESRPVVQAGDRAVDAYFNPVHPDSFGWTFVVWQLILAVSAALCWAPSASRALTTSDEETTRRTFFFASSGMFARAAIPALWGIAAYAYFQQQPDLAAHLQDNPARAAQAMPLLMGKLIPTFLLGILVAGLIAAFMSTHDSYLLAWASVISQDIVAPLKGVKDLSSDESIRVTRISVVAIGVFLLVFGLWVRLPDSVWVYMSVTGTVYLSGAVAALLGGMYWRHGSSTGALWAICGGLVGVLGLFTKPLQQAVADATGRSIDQVAWWLNSYSLGLAPYAACVLLFVAGSLLFPDESAPQTAERDNG